MLVFNQEQLGQLKELAIEYTEGSYQFTLVHKNPIFKPLSYSIPWESIHFGTPETLGVIVNEIMTQLSSTKNHTENG